jgi:type IV secretion system protein VirB9
MLARSLGPALALAFVASLPLPASAQANGTQVNGTGIREVSASGRSLITLQTRVRYTTMVLLPDGEEILDVICGDRDFWVITATHNIAHVKPAKEGAATNMNLVTASGAVYSFLLTEKGGTGMPDLKVYVNADPSAPQGKPKYYSAAQLEELRSELEEARAATDAANRRTTEALAAYQQEYPGKLQFVYGAPKYERPFLVRSIWHDGQFTYIKADATELPALYEIKDGKPGLLNFQVQNGTYVVPKVLDRGYLSLGKERFEFLQQGR